MKQLLHRSENGYKAIPKHFVYLFKVNNILYWCKTFGTAADEIPANSPQSSDRVMFREITKNHEVSCHTKITGKKKHQQKHNQHLGKVLEKFVFQLLGLSRPPL